MYHSPYVVICSSILECNKKQCNLKCRSGERNRHSVAKLDKTCKLMGMGLHLAQQGVGRQIVVHNYTRYKFVWVLPDK